MSDPGSRSAPGMKERQGHRTGGSGAGLGRLPAHHPGHHVPRLTEAKAFPRASPELPAAVPREPGGEERGSRAQGRGLPRPRAQLGRRCPPLPSVDVLTQHGAAPFQLGMAWSPATCHHGGSRDRRAGGRTRVSNFPRSLCSPERRMGARSSKAIPRRGRTGVTRAPPPHPARL